MVPKKQKEPPLPYLHLAFQVILKDTVELLDIMLHEALQRVPAKGLGQFRGANRVGAGGQLIKHTLKRKGHGFRWLVVGGGNVKHSLAEVIGEEKRLKERVHVAGGSLVLQPNISRHCFGVVVDKVVPKDTCRVMVHTNICCDNSAAIVNQWNSTVVQGRVQFSKFLESSESPVGLTGSESMVGIYHDVK